MALTVDSQTVASNPGGTKAQALRYARHYPLWPIVLGAALLLSLFACAKSWWWGIALGLTAVINWLYWSHIKAHFALGCVNPGIVVSSSPFLIAVFTDLSTGVGSHPVIKICSPVKPAELTPQIGTRLVTVALYSGNGAQGRWDDFEPKILDCATSDSDVVRAVFESIPLNDWSQLETGLKQVPQPWRIGLCPIRL